VYNEGVLYLNYSGGGKCHHGQYERNTIINFVCMEGVGDGRPVFVDETDDCTYMFSWHTELVCEEKVRVIPLYTYMFPPWHTERDSIVYLRRLFYKYILQQGRKYNKIESMES
jgi:hypothetical protein